VAQFLAQPAVEGSASAPSKSIEHADGHHFTGVKVAQGMARNVRQDVIDTTKKG
jgi:hypothetical protein